MNGVLVIDKPAGITSHDVVNRVRHILHQRSVGHLGTLDPMATGVLPLVIGNMTRLAQFYTSSEKTYEGVIRFGFATDTYDAEGEPATPPQDIKVSLDTLRDLAGNFRGIIEQLPPPFSAKKIHGVPAYKLARKRQNVPLQRVTVEIKDFEILGFTENFGGGSVVHLDNDALQGSHACFRARVASGTYMRSVAHDMGQHLGCGAHLAALRRTQLAEFELLDAHPLDELRSATPEQLQKIFVHPRKLLPAIPAVTATPDSIVRIRTGRPVNLPELSRARQVKVFQGQQDLIAIATRVAGTLFHPGIVLLVQPERATGGQRTRW